MKSKAERRYKDLTKALRKRDICRKVYDWEWYDNLHQYSKNKIHCSCPLCAVKTRKSKDPCGERKGRHGNMNLPHSQLRVWAAMMQDLEEYYEEEDEETTTQSA